MHVARPLRSCRHRPSRINTHQALVLTGKAALPCGFSHSIARKTATQVSRKTRDLTTQNSRPSLLAFLPG